MRATRIRGTIYRRPADRPRAELDLLPREMKRAVPCPPDCRYRATFTSGLCICGHIHFVAGLIKAGEPKPSPAACGSGRGRDRCPCVKWEFNPQWVWNMSYWDIIADLEAGSDAHHSVPGMLWRLLFFDHEARAEGRDAVLNDALRVRLRVLAEARLPEMMGAWGIAPYSLWSSTGVPMEFLKTLPQDAESLVAGLGLWLEQPLSDRDWWAQESARRIAAERAATASAVDAGMYAGEAKQAVLL